MDKKTKRLRNSVVARVFSFANTQGYHIYHDMWALLNSPEYKDAWTEKERALMLKKLKEFNELLQFFSKISYRLRHK